MIVNESKPATHHYDVAVVGGGPAGLTAGTHCALKGLRTAIFEVQTWGGVLGRLCPKKPVEYYPGMSRKVSGEQLAGTWVNAARDAGAHLREEPVKTVRPDRTVLTSEGTYRAATLILATGSKPATLGVPGEAKLSRQDRGVYYSVVDPERFTRKRIIVVGGGDSAVDAAAMLLDYASQLTIVHRGPELRATSPARQRAMASDRVDLLLNTRVNRISGDERVEGVEVVDPESGLGWGIAADAVILSLGMKPASQMCRELGLQMDEHGRVRTDRAQRTNLPDILAVGDLTSSLEMIVVAVAQGAVAAHHAYTRLKRPQWAGADI